MKALFDLFPVVAFFVAYIFFGRDIYLATRVIMVAIAFQLAILWLRHRRISRMHLISGVLVLGLGSVTLLLRNDLFIKWKPTVAYWVFTVIFVWSQYFSAKPVIERMFESMVKLPRADWRKLNMSWAIFFALLGALNLFVVYSFSEDIWVKFKLFGLMGLVFAFSIGQAFWMARRAPAEEEA